MLLRQIVVSALLIVSASLVSAKEYQIEAIVFANNQPQTAYESTQYQTIAELESEAETWFLEPSMLLEELEALEGAENYRVLAHLSWGQEALPSSEAAIYQITEPEFAGWIKVYAGHLLFANLDIDFNGYRMNEKRRLKLNEKHFFDHPKFGVLLRVSRLEQEEDEEGDLEDTSSNADVESSR